MDVRAGRDLSCFDLTSINDLSDDDIKLIFELTAEFKKVGNVKLSLMKGATSFNAFFEDSTRTRSSFEIGGKKLGIDTINIGSKGSSTGKGETLHDTAQTLAALHAEVIIVRTEFSGIPAFLARHVPSAIINAGDGTHEHPSQGLLDAYTMTERLKSIKGKTILVVGDVSHSRVFGSLVRIAPRLGAKVIVAAPRTFLRPGFQEAFGVECYLNVEEALPKADVVVTLRLQEERNAGKCVPTLREFSKTYGISEKRFALAKKGAILMHPGPFMRDIEVHSALISKPDTVIWSQVENGLYVRMALQWLLGVRMDGKKKPYVHI